MAESANIQRQDVTAPGTDALMTGTEQREEMVVTTPLETAMPQTVSTVSPNAETTVPDVAPDGPQLHTKTNDLLHSQEGLPMCKHQETIKYSQVVGQMQPRRRVDLLVAWPSLYGPGRGARGVYFPPAEGHLRRRRAKVLAAAGESATSAAGETPATVCRQSGSACGVIHSGGRRCSSKPGSNILGDAATTSVEASGQQVPQKSGKWPSRWGSAYIGGWWEDRAGYHSVNGNGGGASTGELEARCHPAERPHHGVAGTKRSTLTSGAPITTEVRPDDSRDLRSAGQSCSNIFFGHQQISQMPQPTETSPYGVIDIAAVVIGVMVTVAAGQTQGSWNTVDPVTYGPLANANACQPQLDPEAYRALLQTVQHQQWLQLQQQNGPQRWEPRQRSPGSGSEGKASKASIGPDDPTETRADGSDDEIP